MRILLDTHVALWALEDNGRLAAVAETILSVESEIFISTASLWEMAIKVGLGKLEVDLPRFRAMSRASGFSELPVLGAHTESLLSLPPIHKDPFDRLLVAQAISEPMRLMTADSKLKEYSQLVWMI